MPDQAFILLAWLQRATGIDSASWVLLMGVIVAVSNLLVKIIPADSTGFLGFARQVLKIVGLYRSPTVTSGTTMMDVAKVAAAESPSLPTPSDVEQVAVDVVGALTSKPTKATRDPVTGRFITSSPCLVTLISLVLVLTLSGCATLGVAASKVCEHESEARAIAVQGLTSNDVKVRLAAKATLDLLDECPHH